MHRFLAAPGDGTYERFMDFCSFDLDGLRHRLGQRCGAFRTHAVALAEQPSVQAALGSLIAEFAAAPIPTAELAAMDVPTTRIWGRHDLATPLPAADAARARYGWPLYVIEDAGDDPSLEQPEAFLDALTAALEGTTSKAEAT